MRIVKPIVATFMASIGSSLTLASFFALIGPGSFGFRAEIGAILIYALPIIAIVGVLLVWPAVMVIPGTSALWKLPNMVVGSSIAGAAIMAIICRFTRWPGAERITWMAYLSAAAVAGVVFMVILRHPLKTKGRQANVIQGNGIDRESDA